MDVLLLHRTMFPKPQGHEETSTLNAPKQGLVKELHVRLDVLNAPNAVSKRSNDEQETLMLLRELTYLMMLKKPQILFGPQTWR